MTDQRTDKGTGPRSRKTATPAKKRKTSRKKQADKQAQKPTAKQAAADKAQQAGQTTPASEGHAAPGPSEGMTHHQAAEDRDAPGAAAQDGSAGSAGPSDTAGPADPAGPTDQADPDDLAERFLELWRAQAAATASGSDAASAIGRLYAGLGADTSRLAEGFEAWGRLIGQLATGQAPMQNPFAPGAGTAAGEANKDGSANRGATTPFGPNLSAMGMPPAFDPTAMMQKFAAPFLKPAPGARPTKANDAAAKSAAGTTDGNPAEATDSDTAARHGTKPDQSAQGSAAPAGSSGPSGQSGTVGKADQADKAGKAAADAAAKRDMDKNVARNGAADDDNGAKASTGDENGRERQEPGQNTDPSRGAPAPGNASGRRDDELAELARRIAALSETINALEAGLDDGSGKPASGDEPAQQ